MSQLRASAITTPLRFEAADGSTVHSPLAVAEMGGEITLLVVDTGSDTHLLVKELTDRLALPLQQGESGTDHSGADIPSWTAGDVTVSLSATPFVLADVVVIPGPPPFAAWGIGGILSPQRLAREGWCAIDLVRNELVLASGSEAADALVARSPALRTVALGRDGTSGALVVEAAVRPFAPVAALIDTGGRHTEFEAAAVPGLAPGQAARLGGGVGGADVVGWFAGPQTLAVPGAEVPVADLAVRREMGYPPSIIGMDVLRRTVVICNDDPGGQVFWQLPP